jgi:hypothetical protein
MHQRHAACITVQESDCVDASDSGPACVELKLKVLRRAVGIDDVENAFTAACRKFMGVVVVTELHAPRLEDGSCVIHLSGGRNPSIPVGTHVSAQPGYHGQGHTKHFRQSSHRLRVAHQLIIANMHADNFKPGSVQQFFECFPGHSADSGKFNPVIARPFYKGQCAGNILFEVVSDGVKL